MSERITDSLDQLIQRLRQAGGGSEIGVLSDAELLSRFVRGRDEAAFEVLVWRHGSMVLGTAQRWLGRTPDAEDAFQATFLTLARKASSIRAGQRLAGWLHRVAVRIASRMLQQRQNRQRREQSLGNLDAGKAELESSSDLAHLLDAEIDRLPERLRRVVVLCYLEGQNTNDAATTIGCPRGTVLSRLAAARKTLQRRLERRGVAPVILAGLTAAAAQVVPGELAAASVRCAIAASFTDIPARVLSLSNRAIHAMFWNKYRLPMMAALLSAICLIGAGIGLAQKPVTDVKADPPVKEKTETPPANADAAKIEALLLERRENLKKRAEKIRLLLENQFDNGMPEQLFETNALLLQVELELCRTSQQRLQTYELAKKSATETARLFQKQYETVKTADNSNRYLHAKDEVLKIEIAMLKEKMKQKSK